MAVTATIGLFQALVGNNRVVWGFMVSPTVGTKADGWMDVAAPRPHLQVAPPAWEL